MTKRRVAVIGGGLAGIAAALAAADGGAEVVLYERRSRLGGLTWSFQRNDRWFDNGQHVFLRCCTAYRALLDRIGAADQVVLQSRLDLPVLSPSGKRSSITRSGLPAPFHLAGSVVGYRHLRPGERLAVMRAVLALRRLDPADPALDTETFGRWLARHGQHEGAVTHLWDLIVLPTVNLAAAEASLALAVKVFRTGLLDHFDSGDIGWSKVPLRHLHGENAARALADAGVDVRCGLRVDELDQTGDNEWSVVWSEPVPGVDEVDAVIVATPPEATEALVPTGAIPPVKGLGASPIVNVHFVLDRTVTDLPIAACVESPIQYVFDRTSSSVTAATSGSKALAGAQCLSISLSAADRYVGMRPEVLITTFRTALDDIFPAARHARLVDATVSREHAATFRGVPGTAALRPAARTGVPGLSVAGAWCATGWPATMEGAVRSGNAAALEALSGTGAPDRAESAEAWPEMSGRRAR